MSMRYTQQVAENLKARRQNRAGLLLVKTKSIRKILSAKGGKWNAVKVLRDIRYAG